MIWLLTIYSLSLVWNRLILQKWTTTQQASSLPKFLTCLKRIETEGTNEGDLSRGNQTRTSFQTSMTTDTTLLNHVPLWDPRNQLRNGHLLHTTRTSSQCKRVQCQRTLYLSLSLRRNHERGKDQSLSQLQSRNLFRSYISQMLINHCSETGWPRDIAKLDS